MWLALMFMGCSDYDLFGRKGSASGAPGEEEDAQTDPQEETAADSAAGDSGDDCGGEALPAEPLAQEPACFRVPASTPYTLELLWTRTSFTEAPESTAVMASPIVVSLTDDDGDGDADADDIPDIVFVTHVLEGYHLPIAVRALSGQDGAELWTFADDDLDPMGFPAAADLDHDGFPEIVVALDASGLVLLSHDGLERWRVEDRNTYFPNSTAPALADLDGDGTPEIVASRHIVDADGTDLRGSPFGWGGTTGNYGATSFAVDLDRDGLPEVVAGNTLYEPSGEPRWVQTDEVDGLVAAADFDLDGDGEIVVSGGLGDGRGEVRLQDDAGTVLWRYTATDAANFGPPVIADFDGDLGPEIGVSCSTSFRVLDTDGTELWRSPTDDSSSGQTGAVAYDFEGDGVTEVVYADENTLWIFAGPDGAVLARSELRTSGTQVEAPVVADVDSDGHVDIVFTNQPNGIQLGQGVVVLTDRAHFGPGRGLWNQFAYQHTNVDDDGSVPAVADVNWDTLNTFRAGDATSMFEGALADLVARMDDACCDDGVLTVWARAGNQGYADVTDATLVLEVETGAGWAEAERRTLGALAAGSLGPSEVFTVEGADVVDVRVRVETSADQCDATNDSATWGEATCG